jgi:hypothetical protein
MDVDSPFPQPISPLRAEAQPHRVTVADVPDPEVWYCAECGEPTNITSERLLGGWARIVCPATAHLTTGRPTKPIDPPGHAEKKKVR